MKNCIGFDIGNHAVHIAVNKSGKIIRSISAILPEGIVQNGHITSIEAMTDVLKDLRRQNKLHIRNTAVVLPAGLCYCRRFNVAAFNRDQLMFNLPYGFHDFISDDKSNYFFDCAVVDYIRHDDNTPPEFDVLAAAVRKDVVKDYCTMFGKAGFKLKTIIPEELSYVNLFRKNKNEHRHGILDIGHNAVRLFFFVGDEFKIVRVIDYGCNALDPIIAEHFGVDAHFIAASYRETDYEGANELPECRNVYSSMAMEIHKALNFYRFNGGGNIDHLHCVGGGVKNAALMDTLRASLPVKLVGLSEIFGNKKDKIDYTMIAAAAGTTMQ